ncbi:hypothetical protein B0A55_01725 [Friedmanniomyces simplex]|uniref:Uncharacterized protein n=1 Tax=Friedmanniomyces simplex TaxID=329884 RepID=A0A4U0Y1T1_9PEZI|nr:hypothetical protein B0A55_01725 [Friedmanniomyces simplex]
MDHLPTFDSMQHLEPVTVDEAMPIVDHALVLKVQHGNTTMNMVFAEFGSGNGYIRLQAPSNSSTSSLAMRDHSGPRFKIKYISLLQSLLTSAYQQQASGALTDGWVRRANSNGIGDSTGFQETGHESNFYYRIITEDRSFDTGFESVNIPCGGMAWAL